MKKTVVIAVVALVAMCTFGMAPVAGAKPCTKCEKETSDDDESFTWEGEDPFSLETVDIPQNFDDLKAMADKISSDIAKNTSKEPATYHKFKSEIDVIDDKLDLYDDALEIQYTDGKIKAETYKGLEKSIDAIDKILDEAEEKLEKQFGFDD